ncbi:MAG: hypothetical protein ACRC2B_15740 [Rubrivivax sp.]
MTTLLLLGSVAPWLQAQGSTAPAGTDAIFTCIDDQGRRITADRPIPSCATREQRVLNKDGSLRMVVPPTLTADERTEKEARERQLAESRALQADAVRRDRSLLARYPAEATHRKAREAALDTVRVAMKTTETRLRELALERTPLLAEAEFYKGKPLPPKLRGELDANDAATAAQRESALTQEAEVDRVNRLYDAELARLKRLWAGAVPGSLGPISAQRAPTPVASSASSPKTSNLR